jgi:hypothetical protein
MGWENRMETTPVSVISVRAQGARAVYFQSRPPEKTPKLTTQPVGGLDFFVMLSGIISAQNHLIITPNKPPIRRAS